MQFKNDKKIDPYIDRLQKNTITIRQFIEKLKFEDAKGLERLFIQIERELAAIKNAGLKKARRLITDYELLKQKKDTQQ